MRCRSLYTLFFLFLPILADAACSGSSPTLTAASAARNDVNDCVTAATDGDTIMIPNGSATWTAGIATTKQIWIRAQNYTPTSGGNATRNVVITNNSADTLFDFTTGNSFHVALSGLRINEGTGDGSAIEVTGSGSKVLLVSDMYFQQKDRFFPIPQLLQWLSQGGVIWNTRFEGIGTGGVGGVGPFEGPFLLKSPRAWETASTMGSADTNGNINVYLEDSSCLNIGSLPDCDDNCRVVFRSNNFDGCWGGTHGFTSLWGGRHMEYYNNTFSVTDELRNIAGRYVWLRAGTVLFTDNIVNNAAEPSAYGNVDLLSIGDNTSPDPYPMPRQPGFGHDGVDDVSDPIYIWNNTGTRGSNWGFQDDPGGWEDIVLLDRDIFVDDGAKPGYSKYTYPHPLREVLEGDGEPPPPASAAPIALRIILQ